MSDVGRKASIAVEEYELASARVEWVRASTCLEQPAQRAALDWHLASREEAFAALPRDEPPTTTSEQVQA
jgi:hypothetical protein